MSQASSTKIAWLRTLPLLFLLLLIPRLMCAQWKSIGPDGGDVRSLTYDPHNPDHIFLGTSAGRLYHSRDGGNSWSRFASLGSGDDYVLDHVAFDPSNPKIMYVSAWSVDSQITGGDLFRSADSGKSWRPVPYLHGKSIRAMQLAASDPRIIVVGSLDGVFRSNDGGNNWMRISPEKHAEIKNIESLAVDPVNPNIIYAGTWHLPWKTDDGGRTWKSIKKGVVDDSDVFSIIIDRRMPSVVYASACSGIYKSENGGELFHKVQGMPFSARRTRVLKQDPANSNLVYAGTTEGLWKTVDSGKTWKRVTAANVIINDIMIDPRNTNKVTIATDRGGVLISSDAGQSFVASNHGFVHRQVASLIADHNDSNTLYAGVLNDKEYGGVFVTHNGGEKWTQISSGLDGRDVFYLRQLDSGALLAGTNRGMFLLGTRERQWRPINNLLTEVTLPKSASTGTTASQKKVIPSELKARIANVEILPNKWLAATWAGILRSNDEGRSWVGGPVLGNREFISVSGEKRLIVAATRHSLLVSADGAATWHRARTPISATTFYGVTVDKTGSIWLASREGAYRSNDGGHTWDHVFSGLPARDITSIQFDGSRVLATAGSTGEVFTSSDSGRSWHRAANSHWSFRTVTTVNGRLLGTTAYDGIVMQVENMPSASSSSGGGSSGRY